MRSFGGGVAVTLGVALVALVIMINSGWPEREVAVRQSAPTTPPPFHFSAPDVEYSKTKEGTYVRISDDLLGDPEKCAARIRELLGLPPDAFPPPNPD